MVKNKILILKNDRGGDLFASIKLISSLILSNKNVTIYLSELNHGFCFLFKNIIVKKINFNLSLLNKFALIFHILLNKYDKIYILSPKSFYFFLPLIFRKIKFYAIVYDSDNRLRPSNYFRKFLYKYRIIYRNKINIKSYRNLQIELLDKSDTVDKSYKSLYLPNIDSKLRSLIPKTYLLFQFRYHFFEKLGWGVKEFDYLMSQINNKYENILFSSDIENNKSSNYFNNYFQKNYSIIDTNKSHKIINFRNKNIFYLKNINAKHLYLLLKYSSINLAKEGLYGHISFFHNKKCHNLYNFQIDSDKRVLHEKISYSEWSKGMNIKFSFLNNDINKAANKILNFI